ncbi:hypothetical protein [Halorussus sp. AFM4]|uniref:hypothetical protein n=1 Tax=Halorussus sp. AFM4 TaxID=3421651 RepID=UPI003EC08A4C
MAAGLIGFAVGRKGGRPALETRFACERVERAERYFERYASVAIGVGAFATIPEGYELLSIASGVLGLDFQLVSRETAHENRSALSPR